MRIKIFLIVLAVLGCLFLSGFAYASDDSFVELSTTGVSDSKIDEDGNKTEVSQQISSIKGTLPLPLNDRNILLISPSYQHHKLKWTDFQATSGITEDDMPENLQSVELAMGLVHRISGKWSVMGRISGGVKSDFEDVSSRDIVFGGLLSATCNYGKGKNLGIGLAYSDSFGSPTVFPILMVKWATSGNLYFNGTLPVQFTGGYRVNDKLSFGIKAEVNGHQYRLTEKLPWNDSVLNYSQILAGPFVQYKFTQKARLTLKFGAVTGQKMEFKDKDDTDKVLAEKDFEDSTFATITFDIPF